jgi:serine/threonine-protein kinase
MVATGSAPRTGRLPALEKYEIKEELGHGGMATVYRAHDKRLARDVAVKVIHPHLRDSAEVAHRFFVEAKAVAKLRHPNIVEVYDVSAEGEQEQYLVVELLRGLTLRKMLQTHGAIPAEVAAAIGIEILNALAHAPGHGVIHRDVKPENVMIEHRSRVDDAGVPAARSGEQPGDRVLVKLTDFGIAKLLDAQGVTSTGQVLGSPAHMAPEQIEGGEVDARADVFGIGVLLYECMVGHLPFEGNNPAQVLRRVLDGIYPSAERERPSVGKRWSVLLDRALARQMTDRFDDATAMRDALCEELARIGIASPRIELETWFDDPEGYAAEHAKKMIGRLCALGATARRSGDVIAAAADYNRALAYAPNDPALLKIVAGMHRAESRRRIVRRAAPIALAAVGLGVSAFFITRAIRTRDVGTSTAPSAALSAPSAAPPPAPAITIPPPAPTRSAAPPPAPGPVTRPPPAKPVERDVILGSVRPQFGVLVAVDDGEPSNALSGLRLTVDGKAHVLHFKCRQDMCEPITKTVEAGDAPEVTIAVAMNVRPAMLVIEGDPALSYGVEEFPSVTLRVGVPASIPVTRGNFVVHVVERPSGRRVSVSLDPGKERKAVFVP